MDYNLVVTATAYDISPQLAAFLLGPGIGSLVDRNGKLVRFLKEVQQFSFGSFHSGILKFFGQDLLFYCQVANRVQLKFFQELYPCESSNFRLSGK